MRDMETNNDEDTLPLPEAVNVPAHGGFLVNIKQEVDDEVDSAEYHSNSGENDEDDGNCGNDKAERQVEVKNEISIEHNVIRDDACNGSQVLLNGLGRQVYSSEIQPGPSLIIGFNTLRERRNSTQEKVKHPKQFACEICFKTFALMYKLQKHKRVHTGEKPYQCQLCLKNFAQNENLMVHMRSHTGEKPFTCETCQKSFVTKSALVTHRRVHTGERPYHCEVCGKAFSTSSYLVVHRRYHSDEKPFICDTCSKSFKTPTLLKKHLISHVPPKILECEECGKNFKLEKSLKIHRKIGCKAEKFFNCGYCGKTSTDRSSLARHVRLHTGERPYSCDKCNASYSDSTALKSHKRKHTDEKPYYCELCGLYFKSPNNLSRHKRNIHAIIVKRGSKNQVLNPPLSTPTEISVSEICNGESH